MNKLKKFGVFEWYVIGVVIPLMAIIGCSIIAVLQ